MKQLTLVLVLLLSLFTAITAQPGNGYGKGGNGNQGQRGERIAQELNLTEKQQEQMKALRTEQKEQQKGAHEEFRAKKSELNALLKESNVDERAVDAKIEEIAAMTEQKMKNRVDHLLKIKEILTPEQFEKFLELKEERMQKHRGRHGNGHKGGGKGPQQS